MNVQCFIAGLACSVSVGQLAALAVMAGEGKYKPKPIAVDMLQVASLVIWTALVAIHTYGK